MTKKHKGFEQEKHLLLFNRQDYLNSEQSETSDLSIPGVFKCLIA